jgi:hypothetical protein
MISNLGIHFIIFLGFIIFIVLLVLTVFLLESIPGFIIEYVPRLIIVIGSAPRSVQIALFNIIVKNKTNLSKHNNPNLFIRLICNKMDEEGQRFLSDIQVECRKSGLTQNEVEIKGLMFAIDYQRGKFIAWMRLPRFLSPIKTRY